MRDSRNSFYRHAKTGLAAVLLSSSALVGVAQAAATDDGARAIEKSLSRYFGTTAIEQKIISVKPQGDSYQLGLDFEKIIGLAKIPGLELKMAPWAYTITEQTDGNWGVKADNVPPFTIKLPGNDKAAGLTEEVKYNNFKWDGVYSTKLMAFLSGKGGHDSAEVTISGQGSGNAKFGVGTFDLTSTDAGNGAVSTKAHQVLKDMVETLKFPIPAKDGAPATTSDATVKVGEISGDADIDSAKNKAILELWAAFLANPSKEALIKNQADFKAKIADALPLWNNIKGTAAGKDLSVVTQVGTFGAKSFSETFAMSGATEHGSLQFGFSFADLTLPAGLVPAADAPLVPTSMDIDLKLTLDGLDRMAKTVLDEADFAAEKPIPDSVGMELAGMAMTSQPKLTIAPSHIVSPSMNVTIAGDVTLQGIEPNGKFTIDAIGLDKTLAALKEAGKTDPEAQKAVTGLSVIRGMAKPGPNGASSFVIEIQGKKVIINGMAIPIPTK